MNVTNKQFNEMSGKKLAWHHSFNWEGTCKAARAALWKRKSCPPIFCAISLTSRWNGALGISRLVSFYEEENRIVI